MHIGKELQALSDSRNFRFLTCLEPRAIYYLFTAILLVIVFLLPNASCSTENENGGQIGVVVTILPQKEFVKQVAEDKVDITVMVQPGASPHTYEPTPSQMMAVAQADLYLKVGSGVEFELAWMDKLISQNKDMLVVDCSDGIQLIEMSANHEHEEESHEYDNDHESDEHHHHEGMDPHIWMSPSNAMMMVENTCEGLIKIDPDNRAFYESNRDDYLNRLTQVDRELEKGLGEVTNRVFMVYHPAFGYLARTYGLTMLPIEAEGKEPTAAGLAKLIDQAREHDIKVIFAEPQFDPKKAKAIAEEIGGKVVTIDPLAEEYVENIITIKNALIDAME